MPPHESGLGVDAWGGRVVDPTKNVESLVAAGEKTASLLRFADNRFLDAQLVAQEKLQNFAREAATSLQTFAREAEAKLAKALLDAETRRIDQLAETRQEFQNTIRDMLAESVRTTSTLVSTQLVQIQATFDTRVSKLEAAAFTQAGQRSVSDPQVSDAITRMSLGLANLKTNTDEAMARVAQQNIDAMNKMTAMIGALREGDVGITSTRKGMEQTNARLLAVVMACAAVASPILAVIIAMTVMRPAAAPPPPQIIYAPPPTTVAPPR